MLAFVLWRGSIMAKRVRRGGRSGSRLKKLKLDNLKDGLASALEQFSPIGGALDGDAPGEVSGRTQLKRSGRRGGVDGADGGGDLAAQREADGDVEVALDIAVTRKGGGGFDGHPSDGFDRAREAYDAYLKGNVKQDAERFRELAAVGVVDSFDPELAPEAVESRGHIQSAKHMVRLYDHWTLNDLGREQAIDQAAQWLGGFTRADNVKKVLLELENTPIRDIYPLEVMLRMLDVCPARLEGIEEGSVLGGFPALQDGRVFAGHAVQIPVPPQTRVKAFALLGGERPGYEFFPSPKDGYYTLQIDTPGDWQFALFAVRTESLGKIDRELPGGTLERFQVKVAEMGRKDVH